MLNGRIFGILFSMMICLSIVVFSYNISTAKDDPEGPRMQFEKTKYDFGTVKKGTEAKHTFKFKNVGTDTLKISQVKTSCGCTAAWESSRIIPPEDEGQIEVRFDTAGRSGRFLKTVYVFSNDALTPKQNLVIGGTIEVQKSEPESDAKEKDK